MPMYFSSNSSHQTVVRVIVLVLLCGRIVLACSFVSSLWNEAPQINCDIDLLFIVELVCLR
jgi:hypothetical protein